MLLIVGVMIGYLTSSVISLLNFFATSEGVHSYLIWGMGSFGGVSMEQMPWFAALVGSGISVALLLVKPPNALLLGRYYAENLGVNVRRTRYLLLFTPVCFLLPPPLFVARSLSLGWLYPISPG